MMRQGRNGSSRSLAAMVRLGDGIEMVLDVLGAISIMIFVAAILADVISRSVGAPLKSCQEIALFAFVWAIFTGSAIAVRHNTHFAIDVLLNAIKGKGRKAVEILDHFALTAFAVVLLVYGWQYALICLKRFSQPSGICMTVGTACIAFGAVCMVYYCAEYFALCLNGTDLESYKAGNKGVE